MATEELSIHLPADVVRMVRDQVESGTYASDSEVVTDALRLWEARQSENRKRLDVIRQKLEDASDASDDLSAAELRDHLLRRYGDAVRAS